MATRNIRNTAVLAKVETTYNTDPTPTGAANAMLVSNVKITPINLSYADRANIRPYLGGSEQLPGTRYVEMSFDVELVGSGTAGTAPAWGPLLRAGAMAETLTASTRADYTPISTGFESVTVYWYDDGVFHKATGVRLDFGITLKVGEIPKIRVKKMIGVYSTPTAAALPAVTLTGWQQPQVVIDAQSGDIILGGTHSTSGAPAITSGTAYPSQGIELDINNSVNFTALLGGETVDITDRSVTGKIMLDLTAAQEVTMYTTVEQADLQTLGITHGTVTGRKVLLWLPNVQLTNPTKEEVNGKRMIGFDVRALPISGNDELRIVTSF